jgi:broad specificity phosphatase PhoE
MTEFLLIRHGETEWNRELIFRGRADIPLSAKGLAQAEQLAAALASEKIDALYASPLSRAQQTAASLAASRGLEVEASDHLLDMNFGEWEGLAVKEVENRFPELFQLWQHHPELCVPPGGESLAEIRDRIKAGLQAWLAQHAGQTIALVTHRVVCKVMLCEILGLDNSAFWRIQQDVCALNRFRREDHDYILLKMNDTGHLTLKPGAKQPDF